MTSFQQPLLFERLYLPKVWGGRALGPLLGMELPPRQNIGETWELYDRPEGSSRLRGELLTLADLMRRDALALLGEKFAGRIPPRFPMLLKFLDAREVLSVQVHPNETLARGAGAGDGGSGDGGKDEAWVVIHVDPSGRIRRGVKPGTTAAQFAAVAGSKGVEELLYEVRRKPGESVAIPAGTVHAIGPGVVVFEVQQNSDITYRLYDWGRPRPVHTSEALAAVRWDLPDPACEAQMPLRDGGTRIIDMPEFAVRRYQVAVGERIALRMNDAFSTLTLLAGTCEAAWTQAGEAKSRSLAMGDTALLPAALRTLQLTATTPCTALVCDPKIH